MESFEQLAFIVWVRESGSLWGYATFLFLHTLGLSTLAGVSAGVDLRVLGFAPKLPLAPMRGFFPVMWGALALTVVSGLVLLFTDMQKLLLPVFMIKLTFIVLAVINLRVLYVKVFANPGADSAPIPPMARALALTSIMLWVGATLAGRLMAYLTPAGGGF